MERPRLGRAYEEGSERGRTGTEAEVAEVMAASIFGLAMRGGDEGVFARRSVLTSLSLQEFVQVG